MKKLFILLSLFIVTASVNAQTLTPRPFASRAVTTVTTADVAGADTIALTPREFLTIVRPSASQVDSVAYRITTTAHSHTGDQIQFQFTNSSGSGHKVRFVGTGILWHSNGADSIIALTASKKATIVYQFDGAAWQMVSKMVQ